MNRERDTIRKQNRYIYIRNMASLATNDIDHTVVDQLKPPTITRQRSTNAATLEALQEKPHLLLQILVV